MLVGVAQQTSRRPADQHRAEPLGRATNSTTARVQSVTAPGFRRHYPHQQARPVAEQLPGRCNPVPTNWSRTPDGGFDFGLPLQLPLLPPLPPLVVEQRQRRSWSLPLMTTTMTCRRPQWVGRRARRRWKRQRTYAHTVTHQHQQHPDECTACTFQDNEAAFCLRARVSGANQHSRQSLHAHVRAHVSTHVFTHALTHLALASSTRLPPAASMS